MRRSRARGLATLGTLAALSLPACGAPERDVTDADGRDARDAPDEEACSLLGESCLGRPRCCPGAVCVEDRSSAASDYVCVRDDGAACTVDGDCEGTPCCYPYTCWETAPAAARVCGFDL